MQLESNNPKYKKSYNKVYLYVKRVMDFLLSLIGIIILSPIFIVISLAIKCDSKGPIIFKQKRYGKNKSQFYIYKFRSMKVEAPENESTRDLYDSGKYITKVGKFLRKTSLDELPQLFNILVGQMSIIGPRPVILKEYELIEKRDKYGANDVKPGITGWAQINGRDKIEDDEKATLDGYYANNMGALLDIKCFFMTILYVFKRKDIVEGGDINIRNIHVDYDIVEE